MGILGSQILSGIGTNIKCGNSLVGADIETVCPSIVNDLPQLQATNAFAWEDAFPAVFAKEGFDFVVGNPPYVEVKNYNVGLPCMAEYIKTVYSSSKNGKIDLAIPFIEKGMAVLNQQGRLGYIIQKRFFKDQYGKGIRKYLTDTKHFYLNGIFDYEENDLFAGRTTYVAILVCDKNTGNNKIEDGTIYGHSKIDKDVVVEYDSCRPLLCNEQFTPLTKREYKTFALFPYEVSEDGEVRELSFSEYSVTYPKAGIYLNKHKKLIGENVQTLPEKNKSYDAQEHWHLFTRANSHGAVYQKICVPMTAQYPQAAVVLDKHVYCDNANMFFIQIEPIDETRLYALSAIINSTIFYAFARGIANPQRGGYFKFNKQFLDPVPVPAKAFLTCNKYIKKLASIAQQIERINEQIKNSIGGKTSGLELSLKNLWRELDELCMKLYGIKKPEDKALLNSIVRKDRMIYGQES